MINRLQLIIERFKNNNSNKFLFQTFFIIIGLIVICFLGFILTKNIELWIDIGIGDEAKYLGDGINIFKVKPDPSWGPLYSLWYFFLNFFSKDSISLYYLNYKLMTIIPCLALYLFLYKMKVTPAFSFYFSFALLISMINLPTWPKVSHFCLTLIFIGLLLIQNIKIKNNKSLAVFILSLILTYIRPEFIVSSIFIFGIIIKRTTKNKFGLKRLIVAVSTILFFLLIIGVPYSAGRNLTAFGQAYHKYLSLNERIDKNGIKDWTEILSDNFGNPKTIEDVVLNNTDKFMKHIEINLSKLPLLYLNSIESLLPNKIFPVSRLIKIFIALFILSSLIILIYFKKIGKYRDMIIDKFAEKKDLIIYSIIFSLPPLVSIILYYPRSHYLLLLLPFIYLVLSPMIIVLKYNNYIKNFIFFCLVITVSFFLLPPLSSYYTKSNFKNLTAVQSITNLNISERINLLENEGGLTVYLPNNFKWIKLNSKNSPFDKFISKQKINMIYFSNSLNNSIQLKNDSTWFEFIFNPAYFNFKKIIQNPTGSIYVRNNVKYN